VFSEFTKEFILIYALLSLAGLAWYLRKRPEKGMRLRFGHFRTRLGGATERPINVVFNYNGHSWDAYEVLGIPAGTTFDKVDQAYLDALEKVDAASRPFIDAAYNAIRSQTGAFKKATSL